MVSIGESLVGAVFLALCFDKARFCLRRKFANFHDHEFVSLKGDGV